MDAALELIPLMPDDRLDTHVPGRPRSYRTLGFHLFRVDRRLSRRQRRRHPGPGHVPRGACADAGTAALVAYGTKVRDRFRAWWQAGDTAPAKRLQTYYGPQSLHEFMERTTWHSGQHVRQYMMLLEKEGMPTTGRWLPPTSPSCRCLRTCGTVDGAPPVAYPPFCMTDKFPNQNIPNAGASSSTMHRPLQRHSVPCALARSSARHGDGRASSPTG